MRLRGQALTLTTVMRVAPRDEAVGSATALPEGVADFNALRARELADRLTSGRDIAPGEIAAYFHTGSTRRVSPPWASRSKTARLKSLPQPTSRSFRSESA